MPFFTFGQNNSGGGFDYDEQSGISHFVVVEADSAKEAVARAGDIGLYFDGYRDCSCCGNRWSDYMDDEDGTAAPEIYGRPADEYFENGAPMKWIVGYEGFIHYKDGVTVGILKEDPHA
ncbi:MULTISPECIES: hypothetical protein [unclassified Streptomyces]|uniref:DUF7296 family protein n=1 Tax=unclassified Streptomyces TaxID=2593676 RepID=UPI0033D1A969